MEGAMFFSRFVKVMDVGSLNKGEREERENKMVSTLQII